MPTEPAALVHDDPTWPMPSFTPGRTSPRRLRVWRIADGTHLAFITERGPGTSVTNVAERAYAAVRQRFPDARVFEHYPAEAGVSSEEHFDEITLDSRGGPRWSPWPAGAIAEWVGSTALEEPFADLHR